MMSRSSANSYLMVKKLESKRQQEVLQEAFKRADVSGQGRLTVDEYFSILQEHNIQATKEEIMSLVEIADKNNDGYITRAEFLEGKARNTAQLNKAEKAFSLMDSNNDGFISQKEMLAITKKLTEKQVEAVFERNDVNKDGQLSKEEFTAMMFTHRK